jgi:hypothetical protein
MPSSAGRPGTSPKGRSGQAISASRARPRNRPAAPLTCGEEETDPILTRISSSSSAGVRERGFAINRVTRLLDERLVSANA